jgi:predicted ester cyclase
MPWIELPLSALKNINTADRPDKPVVNCHQALNTAETAFIVSFPVSLLNGKRVELSLDMVYETTTGKVRRHTLYLWDAENR